MSYPIPFDGYDTFLSAPLDSTDTTAYVNELPAESSGIAVIYAADGRTVAEKISFSGTAGAGTATDPYRLTGLVRKLRAAAVAGVVLFTSSGDGTSHGSNRRIAITDNVNYLGTALAILNGDMPMGGVMQLPSTRSIDSARDVVDKEFLETYASSLGGGVSAFMVSQNGSDPSLTINIGAGRLISGQEVVAYAGASAQAVTNNATNYVQLDWNGTLLINTTGFLEGYVPLAEVVASGGDITSLTDRRAFLTSNGALDKIITDRVTFGATLAALEPAYYDAATGKAKKASASASSTIDTFLGVVLDAGADTDTGKRIQIGGVVTGLSGLTAGSVVYVTNASTFTHTPGAVRAPVGLALSTTSMYLFPLRRISDLMGASSSVTTDILNEMAAFFAATDVGGSEAETLTGGPASNADALHTHGGLGIEERINPYLVSGTAQTSTVNIASTTDGSTLYAAVVASTTSVALYRFTKDTTTGQYFLTHTQTITGLTAAAGALGGLAIIGSYVYVILNDNGGSGHKARRVDAADLANVTSLTYSGGTPANEYCAFTNGTDLFIITSSGTASQYSISGTTLTLVGTVSYTSAGTPQGCFSDNTNVWFMSDSSGTVTIKKYAIAGGATVATDITKLFYSSAYPNAGSLRLSLRKSGILQLSFTHTLESLSAVISSALHTVTLGAN